MARKIRVVCKVCGKRVMPGGRTEHLRKEHPEVTGGYEQNFDFADVENYITEKKEEPLYEPIKNALQSQFEKFVGTGGRVHLEITAKGHFSEELKEVLDDKALSILRVEKISPDIMGFLHKKDSYSKDLVTVEIKPDRIKIRHIWRARLYAEVLNAKYGIIISPIKIPEEIRRFLKDRFNITYRNYGSLVIAQFDKERNEFKFDEKLCSTMPDPSNL